MTTDRRLKNQSLGADDMKCELLNEQNLALMLDFIDDENTKYDKAILKEILNEKNAYVSSCNRRGTVL